MDLKSQLKARIRKYRRAATAAAILALILAGLAYRSGGPVSMALWSAGAAWEALAVITCLRYARAARQVLDSPLLYLLAISCELGAAGSIRTSLDEPDEPDDLTTRFTAQFPDGASHWFTR
jgi:hypothetical protein